MTDEPFEIRACREFLEANFARKRGDNKVTVSMMFAKAEWKAIVALRIWNNRQAEKRFPVLKRISSFFRRHMEPTIQPEGSRG